MEKLGLHSVTRFGYALYNDASLTTGIDRQPLQIGLRGKLSLIWKNTYLLLNKEVDRY